MTATWMCSASFAAIRPRPSPWWIWSSALGVEANFVSAAPPGDYWYSFDGNAQTLDHVLLSSAAAAWC